VGCEAEGAARDVENAYPPSTADTGSQSVTALPTRRRCRSMICPIICEQLNSLIQPAPAQGLAFTRKPPPNWRGRSFLVAMVPSWRALSPCRPYEVRRHGRAVLRLSCLGSVGILFGSFGQILGEKRARSAVLSLAAWARAASASIPLGALFSFYNAEDG